MVEMPEKSCGGLLERVSAGARDGWRLTVCSDPGPDGYIGYGDAVADDVAGAGGGEVGVKGTVEAVGFLNVAVGGVFEFFGGET
jgi:hypothetical protein